MDITCDSCQSSFKLSDDKIPPGRTVNLTCPKCKNKISVNGSADQDSPQDTVTGNGQRYDAADKPFDFIEEEGKTAIVCEMNPLVRQTIIDNLQLMEYQATVADNSRDALKRMRYHTYDLVVVNEDFDTDDPDTNGIVLYLERLGMTTRRNMFVALVSARHRTMDNMMAFHKSVNLIINIKNIEDIGKIISRGITDHALFYRVHREMLKETGRI
jgi:predicted Zn finger-like uncharacterized protein